MYFLVYVNVFSLYLLTIFTQYFSTLVHFHYYTEGIFFSKVYFPAQSHRDQIWNFIDHMIEKK